MKYTVLPEDICYLEIAETLLKRQRRRGKQTFISRALLLDKVRFIKTLREQAAQKNYLTEEQLRRTYYIVSSLMGAYS